MSWRSEARLDVACVLSDAHGSNDTCTLLNFQVEAAHYDYPGFILLRSRNSVFVALGLTWEL